MVDNLLDDVLSMWQDIKTESGEEVDADCVSNVSSAFDDDPPALEEQVTVETEVKVAPEASAEEVIDTEVVVTEVEVVAEAPAEVPAAADDVRAVPTSLELVGQLFESAANLCYAFAFRR